MIFEYFEISDWSELSFEKILATGFVYDELFAGKSDRYTYDKILIEDVLFDVDSVLSLLSSGYDKKLLNGDYSQIDTESSVMSISEQPICVFYSVSNS